VESLCIWLAQFVRKCGCEPCRRIPLTTVHTSPPKHCIAMHAVKYLRPLVFWSYPTSLGRY